MSRKPIRIISLVPSVTELLFDLGLDEEVVGITKFCVHPTEWFRNKQRIGGTKTLNIEAIQSLKPDLIFANKEENVKEQVDSLSKNIPVHVSDIHNVSDALKMITEVSLLCGKEADGSAIINNFLEQSKHFRKVENKTVLYLIWQKPFMAAGADTFIHAMLETAGYKNVITQNRYPEISEAEIIKLNPDYIFLSSEPFPFKQKHVDEFSSKWPHCKVCCVDGEIFSWYGSRMLKCFDYFRTLNEQLA